MKTKILENFQICINVPLIMAAQACDQKLSNIYIMLYSFNFVNNHTKN